MIAKSDLALHKQFTWPILALDLVASGVGPRSYPIEVGVCRWDSPDSPMDVWSALIAPTENWLANGIWSAASQRLHGVEKSALESCLSPSEVMTLLNDLTDGLPCYYDDGSCDIDWAIKLARASDVRPKLKVGVWQSLIDRLPFEPYRRCVLWLDNSPIRNRAGPDAQRLMQGLAFALGRENLPARKRSLG